MNESQALTRRLKRERAARLEAENLLESKSKELHAAVKESQRLTKQLEKTVLMQTHELLSAQRVTKLGTFIWDIESNTFSWSEGAREVIGLDQSIEQSRFKQFLSIIHPDDRYLMQQLFDAVTNSPELLAEPVVDSEKSFRIVLPGEEVRWIKLVCESTDLKSFTGAIQDVSDSVIAARSVRQARVELEKKLADLESTQKKLRVAHEEAQLANATKSRFIAMISHDIRTPINGLLGTLTLLSDGELDDSQQELLQVATSSADLLRVLVNDVIDFARLESGQIKLEPANFKIRELVSQLVDFWRPLAKASEDHLEVQIDDRVPNVLRGDPIRLGQIFNNLLSNAIKFTKEGQIRVAIRPDEAEATALNKCSLAIEVADNGVGIAKSEQANLFKDFSQVQVEKTGNEHFLDLSGSKHGAGLGLAICRALIEQMGGRISVLSSPGKGSTFTIKLALEAVSAIDPDEEALELTQLLTAQGKQPIALIAEDVPANQLVSRMLLQSFGCQVDIANDGIEAVAACTKRDYDFVLMDVSMPRLDGIAATEQIRSLEGSRFKEMPIIGLTAFAFEHEKQRFLDAGMNEVVCKPVVRENLYLAVKSALSIGDEPGSTMDISNKEEAVNLAVLGALTSGLTDAQIRKVVQQVLNDLDKYRLDAISEAKTGDITKLARSCHAVKGLAASFGSQELASLASAIEESAREGDFELAVANTIDRLDLTTDKTLEALEKYLANPSPLSNAY